MRRDQNKINFEIINKINCTRKCFEAGTGFLYINKYLPYNMKLLLTKYAKAFVC